MSSGYISPCGWYFIAEIDPESGSVIDGPVTYVGGMNECVLTASGGSVFLTRISCRKKYPFGVGGKFKAIFRLSRRVYFSETGIEFTPAEDMFHDGTVFNSTTTFSVTNESYYHSGIDEIIAEDSDYEIYFVDTVSGDDTLAAAVNGTGFYTPLDYPDPEAETTGPQAYLTYEAAFEAARGTTSEFTSISAKAVILIRGGTTVDGETENFAAGGVVASTGGASLRTPFIIGSYDHASGQSVIKPRTTTSGKITRGIQVGGSSQYIVVSRNVKFEGTSLHRAAVRFLGSGGVNRSNYLLLGVEVNSGFVEMNDTSGTFTQTKTSITECVLDGNNVTSGNGGAIQGPETWQSFPFRETFVTDCTVCRHGNGDQFHAFYIKTQVDFIANGNWLYECSGTGFKIDSCHGYDVRYNNLVRCNSVGNNESNGHSDAGYPANRNKVSQVSEVPDGGYSGGVGIGAYANWGSMCDNTLTNPLANGDRGSTANALCYSFGQSQDIELRNNLCVFSADSLVVGIGIPRDGGSVNGWYKDLHDCEAVENGLVFTKSAATRQVRLLSVSPAQTDTFDANDNEQHGIHGLLIERNIVAILTSTSGGLSLVRHGTGSPSDFTYSESYSDGRADYLVQYNNLWSSSLTDAFRNGDETDVFSTLAAWEADMNSGADTPCVGNRVENPGFVNGGYEFSDYLITELGHSDLDDAFDSIIAATLSGTMQSGNYATTTAATKVRAAHSNSLDQSNYNNDQVGTESFAPFVSSLDPEFESASASTTTTPMIIFDQGMVVDNGSASIELRQAGTDVVIDSITASGVTINPVDAREITLSGLSLGSATGDVYIYIAADAFKSVSTGINFAGFLDGNGWPFTMDSGSLEDGMVSVPQSAVPGISVGYE